MVQVVTLVDAVLAVLPAAGLFFWAYGRYDGLFRDNVVFLYFIGGLLLGGFLGFLTLLAFTSGLLLLFTVILVALLVPVALVTCVNRRKWQGERHSIFNGGALGLGAAVMMALTALYYRSRLTEDAATASVMRDAGTTVRENLTAGQNETISQVIRDHTFNAPSLGQALLLAAAFAGLLFALGLFAGDAVRRRKQIGGALLGTAMFLPPSVFFAELVNDWLNGAGGEWLWISVLLAYGAIVAFFAERRLMPQGLTEEGRKLRRRQRRKMLE